MKIIADILDETEEDCKGSVDFANKKLSLDMNCDSNETWSEDEIESDDEEDELNLSFREGMKRGASDEFCHDLKRIKFDNNVRDLASNFSFQLDLIINVDKNKSERGMKNDRVITNTPDNSQNIVNEDR